MEYFQLDVRQKIKTLSNGQRAQVALGIALTCSPDLLIMDDPTLGVDAATRIDVLRGIVDVVSRARCTVLFSTHILADAERICDRIGILHDGVLRADAPVQEFKEKVVRYHMKFGDRIPDRVQLPRLVASTLMDKEVLVTVVSPSDDTEKAISEMGPQSCEPVPLSLEEAFVDYTSPRQTRRLVMGTSSGKEAQTS
jgi:ABC-2 type transport system ATP-binding protein